ncbi:hypothetical protein [Marixanthomonas spongiae]|uniref:Uncharacterized protein n=1 Tax=Marixanthomonas spongiae TaxID=2174845 RepID=A0A2U0HWE4_9FLAO|nr:hypothetical protein [Marixanthomonas spongiae]PVW13175.1 hypothetical protein DDV96_13790 [Marixanthomonas spongiae]
MIRLLKCSVNNNLTLVLLTVLFTAILLQSCKNDKKQDQSKPVEVEKEKVVEIVTESMDFQMPDTITSGWNTFRYINKSPQVHFFLVEKYPEGKTIADAQAEVVPYFSSGMNFINEGDNEKAMDEFGKLPKWYQDVEFSGGSGLVSAGKTCETTLELQPGYYIVECYVKMSNGEFHTTMGMIDEFVVSEAQSGIIEPTADYAIELSRENGITFKDSIPSGKHTFSVTFNDQVQHENFVGHDINLVRLNEQSDLATLESWMNWANPKGLIEPAPENFTFLGGVNDMPAGSHAYFTETLKPGTYALISEVPNTRSKNMLKTFLITD